MTTEPSIQWLKSGDEAFREMLAAIAEARTTIHFETYIFGADEIGGQFRQALIRARERGVAVKILIDGLGSFTLPPNYWDALIAVGGEVHWFNPLGPKRFEFRNHRKLLACDGEVAFIGGFNVAKHYQGDGIKSGWRDLGLKINRQRLVKELVASFEEMYAHAKFWRRYFHGRPRLKNHFQAGGQLLLSEPGRRNPFKRQMRHDLARAQDVKIIMAYFLPTWRIRRELANIVQRGGRVQLILAGKSDVALSQMACRSLYRRLLKAGVEIYEYNPQILHAKLVIIDDAVYAGSSNLDPRSFHINYELMVRFEDSKVASEAREIFAHDLTLSSQIELSAWKKAHTWWRKLRQRWAYLILAQVDPLLARRQYRGMTQAAQTQQ
jgi:cardiolipin synthase